MKLTVCSLWTVFGLLLSLLVAESVYAGCPKNAEANVNFERVAESVEADSEGIESSKRNRVEEERDAVARRDPDEMQKKAVKPPELGLEQLVERLKKTKAIGFITKLAIRSDVFDFKESIESYRKKKVFEDNVEELRGRFNGLLLKILALLDSDPVLSRDIYLARDSIWKSFVEVKS
ncbi:MAG: hypothetical protein R8K54_04680, partial [Mariprofundaceae bacterium]